MRIAVITGGMGGLGDSISAKMHAAGYRVVVTHSPGNTKAKEWISEHKASGCEFSVSYALLEPLFPVTKGIRLPRNLTLRFCCPVERLSPGDFSSRFGSAMSA